MDIQTSPLPGSPQKLLITKGRLGTKLKHPEMLLKNKLLIISNWNAIGKESLSTPRDFGSDMNHERSLAGISPEVIDNKGAIWNELGASGDLHEK